MVPVNNNTLPLEGHSILGGYAALLVLDLLVKFDDSMLDDGEGLAQQRVLLLGVLPGDEELLAPMNNPLVLCATDMHIHQAWIFLPLVGAKAL